MERYEVTDQADLLAALRAMAHASRLRLLGILADGEWSVHELADLLGLSDPTISHHLARLMDVGLVTMRREGAAHLYALRPERLQAISRQLEVPEQLAPAAQPAPDGDELILRRFLAGERLTQIPSHRKKRQPILRWLAAKLEPGVRYGELELNALLRRHHEDVATLRRELVAEGLLVREASTYWLASLPAAQG